MPRASQAASGCVLRSIVMNTPGSRSSSKRFRCHLFKGGERCQKSYPTRGNLYRHFRVKHGWRTSNRRAFDSMTSTMQVAPSLHHVPETPGPSQTGSDASLATYFIPAITPPIPPFEGLFSTLDDSLDHDRISVTSIDVDTLELPYPSRMSATSGYTHHHASVAPFFSFFFKIIFWTAGATYGGPSPFYM